MINLDISNLVSRAANVPECYIYSINKDIKSVMINGKRNVNVIYCDVAKGFALVSKTHVDGSLFVVDGEIVHEIVFGVIEVLFNELDKPTN